MTNISLLGLRIVKEKSGRYDIDRKITGPTDIHRVAVEVLELDTYTEEVFSIITLDTKNKITGTFIVSQGTINASLVHPREVFKRALMQNASAIILLHNHPSGDPHPSKEDVNITRRLAEAGKLIGVEVLDHVIIGDNNYVSFKEMNLM